MDISVAIQLLHCKPSSFSACKLENVIMILLFFKYEIYPRIFQLPPDFQQKAKFHIQQEGAFPRYNRPEKKEKVIRVPISAFPSTTVIYSIPSSHGGILLFERISLYERKYQIFNSTSDDDEFSPDVTVPAETMVKVLEERQQELHDQTPNGSRPNRTFTCPSGLHASQSMPFLDGLQYVDHGTQTYPNFIGEREKTRNTCIFCQGLPSSRLSESDKSISPKSYNAGQ